MTDVWSQRADAFRESPTHREGPDLDLLVEWCEPGARRQGARRRDRRRSRRAGACATKAAPSSPSIPLRGCSPDVVSRAEDLPFEDGSFDVVTCRIAAHHFQDIRKAVAEMARVTQRLVVIEDNVFVDEQVEEAERLRDPTHVRCYTRGGVEGDADRSRSRGRAGRALRAPSGRRGLARTSRDPARRGRTRVRELLEGHIHDGVLDAELDRRQGTEEQK